MTRVLVIECARPLSQDQADAIGRRASATLGSDYAVIVVPPDIRVYEIGRWLWQRAIRRVTA